MKKTLADLKRDSASGKMFLLLLERYGKTADAIPDRLRGVRPVVGCNSVAITLQNRSGEKSEMRFSAASLTDYTGETLTLYEPGKREPNADEAAALAAASEARKAYQDRNPYANSYYFMRDYWEKSAFPYLDGLTAAKGKRYTNGVILDNAIKGAAILVYKVIFAASLEEAEQKSQESPESGPRTAGTVTDGEKPGEGQKRQEEPKKPYKYGMKYRGYSIGAQPAGVVAREDDASGQYYDIISYNTPLTPEQISAYELQPIEDSPRSDSEPGTPAPDCCQASPATEKESASDQSKASQAAKEQKKNRIPRNAKKIFFTWLIDTTGNSAGERASAEKNDRGEWIETTANGKKYCLFVSMLRNGDIIQIENIETEETTKQPETAPAPTQVEQATPDAEKAANGPENSPEAETCRASAPDQSPDGVQTTGAPAEAGRADTLPGTQAEDPTPAGPPETGRNGPDASGAGQTTTRDASGPISAKNPPYTPRPELSTIYTRGSPVKTINPMTTGQGGQL